MSALKRHIPSCSAHMSAFGGKADMTLSGNPLLRSLLGVKRTSLFAPHMFAFDPKQTFSHSPVFSAAVRYLRT